ncbi:MAG: YneF family protein [Bacilli bacterium]|nr:YneF family protein [Bacilli bacterium]
MMEIQVWQLVLYIILGIIGGAIAGFFGARAFFKYQLKKNPPINEKMIRAMFMSMGRKPSEAQVRAVMNSMSKNQ